MSVRQFDRILDALYENSAGAPCSCIASQGISRAPSLAAAYMDAVGYKSIDAALEEIRKLRPSIHPSNILLNSLKENLQ